ncbi:hypothetical protein P3T37_004443 [Kitasatospora sp. MAA4]|nr:hypothetical protein [Kitasatospora sp. MAA4]
MSTGAAFGAPSCNAYNPGSVTGLPCILTTTHSSNHMDAVGGCWPQPKPCNRCNRPTEAPIPIIVERASGPAWTVHLCPDCATRRT